MLINVNLKFFNIEIIKVNSIKIFLIISFKLNNIYEKIVIIKFYIKHINFKIKFKNKYEFSTINKIKKIFFQNKDSNKYIL